MREAILDEHNRLRSLVASGRQSGQPAAADMNKLRWDAGLERVAQM